MTFLQALAERPLLWDGAMGTEVVAQAHLPVTLSVESLNLSDPALIQRIHQSYVDAGADILQTNSYQATCVALAPQGLNVRAVNEAAVRNARTVADRAGRPVWVAGSVGPLGDARYTYDILRDDQIEAVYREQVEALVAAGVDLLLAETMQDYREVLAVARVAQAVAPEVPLVVQLEVVDGQTLGGRINLATVVRQLEPLGIAAIGANCRVGPEMMQRTARYLLSLTDLPLSIQPNAGIVGVDYTGRMQVIGDEGDFATMAEWALAHDVRLVGSCCHSTPRHTAAMRAVLDQRNGQAVAARPRGYRSRLDRKLHQKEFVICVEIDPPTDDSYQRDPGILQKKIDGAKYLEQRHGIDIVTIADHTMGKPWLDPFPFAEVLRPHLRRADILLHYACRNKAETDISGNFASFKLYGYHNILIITGDPPGNPDEACFFHYSSTKLLERVRAEHGESFLLGCAFDHTRGMQRGERGIEGEVRRLERKIAAGANLALTQPVYLDRIELLREKTRHLTVPVLPGIMPVMSLRHAEAVSQFGGIVIPDYVRDRLAEAGEDAAARAEVAIEVCGEVARRARALGFPGIYLITAFNRFDVISGILRRLEADEPEPVSDLVPA